MKRLCLFALILSLMTIPTVTRAQTLQSGTWSGTTVTPSGEEVKIRVDVTVSGDSTHMVLNTIEHGSFTATDIQIVSDTLKFKFQPGPLVDCVLPKQADGSYAGTCSSAESGDSASMSMVPPAKE
jgi:hypothetical protein